MHENDGACAKCDDIFDRYPNFHEGLRTWFKALQIENPEAHISCAGRGRIDQEVAFHRHASNAHYGQSAHNFNLAIDLWENRDGVYTLDPAWFVRVVAPALYSLLSWYGAPDAKYKELPHVEVANWKELVQNGDTRLVE